tara:strand:+ start:1112 stop:2140 length:1029 start_codon:yes stop_codon:yes gene_type:complete
MTTKRVATPYARKLKVLPQNKKTWSTILFISVLMLFISCSKNDDLVSFENEINVENKLPVANPGPNQTIVLPTNLVNLDGSASTDADNPITGYNWSKISGPAAYSFINAKEAKTQVTDLQKGVYQFELTVTNSLGLSGKGVVQISVFQDNSSAIVTDNDINLMLPQDWVVLNNSFGSSAWIKISGPDTYTMGDSYSGYSVIFDLIEGNYQFEVTVNHENGTVSKDTANVNVYDVSSIPQNAKEMIIKNVTWTFPWYSTLAITDFYSKIPRESLFRIFLKRDGSSDWQDVPGYSMSSSFTSSYDYFIERRIPDGAGMYANGSLYISYYGADTSDTPDIKIVYW